MQIILCMNICTHLCASLYWYDTYVRATSWLTQQITGGLINIICIYNVLVQNYNVNININIHVNKKCEWKDNSAGLASLYIVLHTAIWNPVLPQTHAKPRQTHSLYSGAVSVIFNSISMQGFLLMKVVAQQINSVFLIFQDYPTVSHCVFHLLSSWSLLKDTNYHTAFWGLQRPLCKVCVTKV